MRITNFDDVMGTPSHRCSPQRNRRSPVPPNGASSFMWMGSTNPARQASLCYRLRPRGVSETDPVETLGAGSARAHRGARPLSTRREPSFVVVTKSIVCCKKRAHLDFRYVSHISSRPSPNSSKTFKRTQSGPAEPTPFEERHPICEKRLLQRLPSRPARSSRASCGGRHRQPLRRS